VGRDFVGFVAEVTQVLYQLGMNLLDSSMTLLRGEFALILMAELSETGSISELETRLKALESKFDMGIHVRELSDDELKEPILQNCFLISIYGADKPGIVAHATRALADQRISITDLQTKLTGHASKIFVMILEVTAPTDMQLAEVQRTLESTTQNFGVEITVKELDFVEL